MNSRADGPLGTRRWAYAQPPQTHEEFTEAIREAYEQGDSLLDKSDAVKHEAYAWYDRAALLEHEYDEFLDKQEAEHYGR